MVKRGNCDAGVTREGVASIDGLTREQALLFGRTQRELGHLQFATSIFTQIREAYPADARAAYLLGICLLDVKDSTGLEHLKHAMAQDETCTGAACARAILFLRELGDREAERGYRNRLEVWQETGTVVLDSAESILPGDRLSSLQPGYVQAVGDSLKSISGGLACAYVVRKHMPEWCEGPVDWLLALPRKGSNSASAEQVSHAIADALAANQLSGVRIKLLEEGQDNLLNELRQVEGACLWDQRMGIDRLKCQVRS